MIKRNNAFILTLGTTLVLMTVLIGGIFIKQYATGEIGRSILNKSVINVDLYNLSKPKGDLSNEEKSNHLDISKNNLVNKFKSSNTKDTDIMLNLLKGKFSVKKKGIFDSYELMLLLNVRTDNNKESKYLFLSNHFNSSYLVVEDPQIINGKIDLEQERKVYESMSDSKDLYALDASSLLFRYYNIKWPLIASREIMEYGISRSSWSILKFDDVWSEIPDVLKETNKINEIKSNRINVILPYETSEVTYEIKDSKGTLVANGNVDNCFVSIPDETGLYELKISFSCDDSKYYKGEMTLTLHYNKVEDDQVIVIEEENVEEYILLKPLLKELGFSFDIRDELIVIDTSINDEVYKSVLVNDKNIISTDLKLCIDGFIVYEPIFIMDDELYIQKLHLEILGLESTSSQKQLLISHNKKSYPMEYELEDPYITRFGYVDIQGKWKTKPIFKRADHFIDSTALVSIQDWTGELSFKNRDGPFFLDGEIYNPEITEEEHIAFKKSHRYGAEVYGVVNLDFNIVESFNSTEYKSRYKNNSDYVYTQDEKKGDYANRNGLKHKEGEIIFPNIFNSIGHDYDDVFRFSLYDYEGYITSNYEVIGGQLYMDATDHSSGYAAVSTFDSEMSYYIDLDGNALIGKDGNIVTFHSYYQRYLFRSNRAIFYEDSKYGIRDIYDNIIAPAVYDEISPYENGFAYAKIKDGYNNAIIGYIDLKGKFIVAEKIDFKWMDYKGLKYYDYKIE